MNASLRYLNRALARIAKSRAAALLLLLASCGHVAACGYHVVGHSDALPKNIHVIAVPALENATNSYRIEQKLTSATVREFLAATPYKITSNPATGDAVLRGKVLTLQAVPLLFHPQPGRP